MSRVDGALERAGSPELSVRSGVRARRSGPGGRGAPGGPRAGAQLREPAVAGRRRRRGPANQPWPRRGRPAPLRAGRRPARLRLGPRAARQDGALHHGAGWPAGAAERPRGLDRGFAMEPRRRGAAGAGGRPRPRRRSDRRRRPAVVGRCPGPRGEPARHGAAPAVPDRCQRRSDRRGRPRCAVGLAVRPGRRRQGGGAGLGRPERARLVPRRAGAARLCRPLGPGAVPLALAAAGAGGRSRGPAGGAARRLGERSRPGRGHACG